MSERMVAELRMAETARLKVVRNDDTSCKRQVVILKICVQKTTRTHWERLGA